MSALRKEELTTADIAGQQRAGRRETMSPLTSRASIQQIAARRSP
jgi:hypothetical protein